ncbi:MAG: hypothetical protein ACFCUV_22380 [Rivularia sp. (in: cyanobacteria)]
MNLLQQLRTIALTFECLSNQADFQRLAEDSRVRSTVPLVLVWQGIEEAIRILETDE